MSITHKFWHKKDTDKGKSHLSTLKILIKYIVFHFQEYIAQITGRGDILQYLSVKSQKKKKKAS